MTEILSQAALNKESQILNNNVIRESALVKENNDVLLPPISRDDVLSTLSLNEKFSFYERLAQFTENKDKDSLAAMLMKHWLNGKGALKIIPNDRIKVNPTIQEKLLIYRKVFLSKEKTSKDSIGGVIPRIKTKEWDGISSLSMNYMGKTFEIVSTTRYIYLQTKALLKELSSDELIETDLFTSLHATSLDADVIVVGEKLDESTYKITFTNWTSKIKDNYNWEADKHLTVPNPDYKNFFGIPNPVLPNENKIKIYHRNAKELELNGLAHSFNFESETWEENSQEIIKPEIINIC